MTRNAKIAVSLIVISCLFWAGVLLLPFLELSGPTKAKLSLGLIVCGEATFWLGALIVGRDVMKRYCKFLHPKHWRFRSRHREESPLPAIADSSLSAENGQPDSAAIEHPTMPPGKSDSPLPTTDQSK